MPQHSEAFQPEPYPHEERPPEKKKEAVILPFLKKVPEGTAGEKAQDYEKYKTLSGALRQEQYQDVLKRAAEGTEAPTTSQSSTNVNFMAQRAGIALSPETVTIYGILRNEKPDGISENYHEMSDQKLLAEALRMVGDTASLTTFIEKYPHIFN